MKKMMIVIAGVALLAVGILTMKSSWPTPSKGALTYVLTPSKAEVEKSSDGKYRYIPVKVKVKNTSGKDLRVSDYQFVLQHQNKELTAVTKEQVAWKKGKTLSFDMYYTDKTRYEREDLSLLVKGKEIANASYNDEQSGDFAVQYVGVDKGQALVKIKNRTNQSIEGAQVELGFQQKGVSVMKYDSFTLKAGQESDVLPVALNGITNVETFANEMQLMQMTITNQFKAAQVEKF